MRAVDEKQDIKLLWPNSKRLYTFGGGGGLGFKKNFGLPLHTLNGVH